MTRHECIVCGSGDEPLRFALIEWLLPVAGVIFDQGRRCVDIKACRQRCQDIGDPWPLRDPYAKEVA